MSAVTGLVIDVPPREFVLASGGGGEMDDLSFVDFLLLLPDRRRIISPRSVTLRFAQAKSLSSDPRRARGRTQSCKEGACVLAAAARCDHARRERTIIKQRPERGKFIFLRYVLYLQVSEVVPGNSYCVVHRRETSDESRSRPTRKTRSYQAVLTVYLAALRPHGARRQPAAASYAVISVLWHLQ